MCELREARLDEEDAGMEVGRSMEQVKKDRESLAKKERIMDQALKVPLPPPHLPLSLALSSQTTPPPPPLSLPPSRPALRPSLTSLPSCNLSAYTLLSMPTQLLKSSAVHQIQYCWQAVLLYGISQHDMDTDRHPVIQPIIQSKKLSYVPMLYRPSSFLNWPAML